MRKSVSPKVAMATLSKGEKNASDEIQKEIDFALTYQGELRDILYNCQQLAKAQTQLMIITGRLKIEDLANKRKEIENQLFSKAFESTY